MFHASSWRLRLAARLFVVMATQAGGAAVCRHGDSGWRRGCLLSWRLRLAARRFVVMATQAGCTAVCGHGDSGCLRGCLLSWRLRLSARLFVVMATQAGGAAVYCNGDTTCPTLQMPDIWLIDSVSRFVSQYMISPSANS